MRCCRAWLPVGDPERLYYVQMESGNQPPGATNTVDSGTSFSEPVFEALRRDPLPLPELQCYCVP